MSTPINIVKTTVGSEKMMFKKSFIKQLSGEGTEKAWGHVYATVHQDHRQIPYTQPTSWRLGDKNV
jgi:hypothetical protein